MRKILASKRAWAALGALFAAMLPAQAGLLNIATDPLGTATSSIKPNVMFILDDSGSMASDYMPDYVNDSHNAPTTTAACADTGNDSDGSGTGTINGSPNACVFGDPPFNSPDFNGIYYNPAILYRPAANADGSDMPTQNRANTLDWTAVKINPYTSTSTTNLAAEYPDRVFCINSGDAVTSGNCRQNTAYEYPNTTFKYSLSGLTGSPYYYRMQSAQYCQPPALTNCASGSSIDLTVHTQLAPEFCLDADLTSCAAGAAVTASHIFSGVRWCADANTLSDCRRKKGDLLRADGTVVKTFLYAKHLGVTQSITCPVGSFCNAAPNEGNIRVNSVNSAGGTIQNITIGGVSVIASSLAVAAGTTPSGAAGQIVTAINAHVSSPDFTATQSGSDVIITQVVAGATGSGAAVVVSSNQIGTASSIGKLTVSSGSSSSQRLDTITVGGTNLLCPIGADQSFGNGVTVKAPDGRIEMSGGTNSTGERTSLRNAIESRIDTCAVNGFSASISSADVNIIAPVSAGSGPNGQVVARTGSNIANITTSNMGTVQSGTQVSAITTTVALMSGGRDALTGTHTVRKGVGAFSRTDIVPANNSYPKSASRIDCAGATCTYDEEMTNFANWYAFYRTRMQMMKAAVGRAFVSLGDSYRVGFITICPVSGNDCGTSSAGASVVTSKYLKVADFDATHKAAWYAKLYAQQPSNFTPLREALSRVGLIFGGQFNSSLTGGLTAAADDPVTASCQPNFAILSTDGYWNGGPGKRLDGTTNIGNQDNANVGPFSLLSQGVYDGNLTGATDTLADVALYYYGGAAGTNDLRPSLANNVPTTNKDTNGRQHMVTFTLGLGLDGLLSYRPDYETAASGDFFDIKQGTKKWPVPAANAPSALDDLWHAAVNGRGVFFSAKNPEELSSGLSETLNQLQARVGAGAAAATSNLQPVAGDNFAFTAQYQTANWIGDVKARTIDLSSGIVSQVQLWSAATLLEGVAFTNRTLYTYDPTDTAGNRLKHFCWPGEGGTTCSDGTGLSDGTGSDPVNEKAFFHPDQLPQWAGWSSITIKRDTATQSTGPTWSGPNAGQHLVNWLRGAGLHNDSGQSLATDLFRERVQRLGDVINAQPAYVKKAPFSYSDTGYAAFKKCTEGTGTGCASAQFPAPALPRRGTVYAASNDGMLHAFETDVNNDPYFQTAGIATAVTTDDAFTGNNAGNGAERWSYLPRAVLDDLYKLADTSIPFPHSYHVDGSPLVGDICITTPCAGQNDWRTILVAGLNSGGRGYYALDVTNPLAPKALWEFTNSTTCVVTDLSGVPTATLPVGGDYTSDCHLGLSYGNPLIAKRKSDGRWIVLVTSGYNNNVNGGDGKGYLYMLDAVTGQILRRFTTGVGTAASPSGLAKINGWVDSALTDNTVLAVYGGDLEGNLWRFLLDPVTASPTKIATLVNSAGDRQPITVKPELGEVDQNGIKKRVVMVGTGKFLEESDKTGPFITHTIYALRDDLIVGAPGPVISDVRNASLVKVRAFATGSGPDTRTVAAGTAPTWTTDFGWLIDLPDSGEHVNVDPQLQLGTLVVASNVPTSDTCTAGGYSWINFLDFKTGSFVQGATGNMASTKIGSSLAVGMNVIMLPGGKVVSIVTTADNQQLTKDTPVPMAGFGGRRVSWRELIRDQ